MVSNSADVGRKTQLRKFKGREKGRYKKKKQRLKNIPSFGTVDCTKENPAAISPAHTYLSIYIYMLKRHTTSAEGHVSVCGADCTGMDCFGRMNLSYMVELYIYASVPLPLLLHDIMPLPLKKRLRACVQKHESAARRPTESAWGRFLRMGMG